MDFLQGWKTNIGLITFVLGVLHISNFVMPEEAASVISAVFTIGGIVGVVYGRIMAYRRARA